jgi:hypothetical protein
MKKYSFEDIQQAFTDGSISWLNFIEILVNNFGKKKARKILRKNLEPKLKKEGMSFQERQQFFEVLLLIV